MFLLPLVDLLHDDMEAAMGFDGALRRDSANFAGQATISRSLACQSTPKRLLDRFPSRGPQVSPLWENRNGRLAQRSCGRNSVRANRPDTATKSEGNLFFFGGHIGGQDTVCRPISLLYTTL